MFDNFEISSTFLTITFSLLGVGLLRLLLHRSGKVHFPYPDEIKKKGMKAVFSTKDKIIFWASILLFITLFIAYLLWILWSFDSDGQGYNKALVGWFKEIVAPDSILIDPVGLNALSISSILIFLSLIGLCGYAYKFLPDQVKLYSEHKMPHLPKDSNNFLSNTNLRLGFFFLMLAIIVAIPSFGAYKAVYKDKIVIAPYFEFSDKEIRMTEISHGLLHCHLRGSHPYQVLNFSAVHKGEKIPILENDRPAGSYQPEEEYADFISESSLLLGALQARNIPVETETGTCPRWAQEHIQTIIR